LTTPLRRQYLDIKRRYPQAILFFRLGDFYETFDEDAELVARELEITLTSRPVGKNERVPLAGVPHHALDTYLSRLINKGYKVAVCEQMEAATAGKKIVDRQVVRVVTPGTLLEDRLLERGANNYLAALVQSDGRAGLAYVDVSTGEFGCLETTVDGISAEMERLEPAELLLPQGDAPPTQISTTLTPLSGDSFDGERAKDLLLAHFGAASLDALGLASSPLATRAAGAIAGYLKDTQQAGMKHVQRLVLRHASAYMRLDANTRRNLELFEPMRPGADSLTLLGVIDETRTAMGARLLRAWLGEPLLDITALSERLDAVQHFFDSAVRRGRVMAVLAKVPDLERLIARISSAAAAPALGTPRDLTALCSGLEAVPALREAVEHESSAGAADARVKDGLLGAVHPCQDAASIIAAAIADESRGGSAIRPGFSEELDALRETARDARQYLADLELRERERTGIKNLKVGYNRVFGYYIEVSKAAARQAPEDYQRKQTLVGGERYTTPELRDYEYRVLHAVERQEELEQALLRQACQQVAAQAPLILETAAGIARIDACCGLAEAAALHGYVRPVVNDEDEIFIRDGRHPMVERMLEPGTFVQNDCELACSDGQVILLTGPNMAGKSTYLRQVALIVLMAQAGSFVPAAEARIGVVDRIFSRVGAFDDIAAGRSTFMLEMLETAEILHGATPRSLLIFDEIGRGTSTYDGVAIARAVVEFIHNRPDLNSRTLFATHYHELTELASFLPRVRNYNVAVAEEGGGVVFLHRILPGGADRSFGVHVAQLAGLPRPVVIRAREILSELESGPGAGPRAAPAETFAQLALFGRNDGLRRDLATLEVDSMTPLQAITKLYELVEKARNAG